MPHISDEFIELAIPRFCQFVFVVTASVKPSSIAMAAAASGLKYIELPGTGLEDLALVQRTVQEHYQECRGGLPLFGQITGYFFAYTESEGVLLTVDGEPVEHGRRTGRFHPQSIAIQNRI